MSKGTVLVADDDSTIRVVLNQALTRAGFDVRVTSNTTTLWQWISDGQGDCVVSDVIMPDGEAFELLPKITGHRPDLPVILISAQNTFMTALRAQEAGAYDYLPKPFDLEELIRSVTRAINEPRDNRSTQTAESYSQDMPLVGRSPAMQELYRTIARLTTSDLSVILAGEVGTGKRLTARVLHDFGQRKHGPFVPVSLSALPADLIETRLFGHVDKTGKLEAGAIREADGGTLYLDEIGDLPLAAQTRLLRVLMDGEATPVGATQPGRVDIRLVSSTTHKMETLIERGQFREDLYYYVSVVPLYLPPLKDRRDDIADLARHFLKISEIEGAQPRHLDPNAVGLLKEYLWPGNVRELENLIRRICTLYPQETVTRTVIEAELKSTASFRQGVSNATTGGFSGFRNASEYFIDRYFDEHGANLPPDGVYQRFLDDLEYPVITAALAATNGNQIRAAKLLGLNRNTLRKKIRHHGIRIVKTAR